MLLLLRTIAFVAALAPCVGNAQYRLPDYAIYASPPGAPEDEHRTTVRDDSERYFKEMQRRHEYQKRQFEEWREYQKKQNENWREYRKKQIEAWHENRKRRFEHWREFLEH